MQRTAQLLALGKAIRELRERQGISQEKLALAAGVDRAYLGRIERGENNAALLTIAKIAKALGVSVAKLAAKAKL